MQRPPLAFLVLSSLALAVPVAAQAPRSQVSPRLSTPAEAPAPPQTAWTILAEPLTAGQFFSATWVSDVPYDMVFTLTDLYVASDRYEVYDGATLIFTTPAVNDWDVLGVLDPFTSPPYATDPDLAFSSGFFSKASITLGPGPHSIKIRDIHLPPSSIGGPPFEDGTVAFKAAPACAKISALPGVVRDTVPPQAARIVPFSQDRIIIGASSTSGVAPPDVQFLPPNPATAEIIVWAFSMAPDNIPVSGIGTFLISVTPPDPLVTVAGIYAAGDVLTADFVPNSCSLVGVEVYTQGAVIETGGSVVLTNAIDYVIGLL
jgi:hypothetical protein